MSAETFFESNVCGNIPSENEKVVDDEASSYCTDCREELDNSGVSGFNKNTHTSTKSNNFDKNFMTNITETLIEPTILEPLNETTKSFSQISLEHENCEDNIINEKCSSNNDMRQIYFVDTTNRVEVENEILIELLDNNGTFHPKDQQIHDNKTFCDKEVQTDPQLNDALDPWDSEFPSEAELRKIEGTIENIDPTVTEKQTKNKSLNVQDNRVIKKKAHDNLKPNYNLMTAIFLNRRKRLTHLANDIYQLSSYLDGIRKALSTKEPLSIKSIPSPPAISGYDSQFDFPNESRFGKLPIQIQSAKTTNKPSGGINITNSAGSSSRIGCTSSKPVMKRMNNGRNESAPKRFMCQTVNKDAVNANKENRGNEKSRKQSMGDSSSMYEYNPLSNRSKTNSKMN